ncbi:putative o-methyltransferase family 3 [Diplodia seriata]|uniref:O-methyltransferase mdmC n=1 Tax=Diplodia seriata TaxID=420778 RepID=A0A0G2EW02_9PEZI|nr:putative o-methyltransferase family 3 [Diplodia seriata]OMP86388.1 O-methyltransferase mdmC [Diplodia seriata]
MSGDKYAYGSFGSWEPVDNYTSSHLDARLGPSLTDALDHAEKNSQAKGLPDIAVSRPQGKFLMLQARLLRAKHVVEVGTLGGYSSIWFAHASPDIKVTTIEVDEHHAAVARENHKFAGVDDRVEVIVGSGSDVMAKLVEEVNQGKRERFGLAFIDADKENNWTYFDHAANMSVPGACLIVDNVVRQGALVDPDFAKANSRVAGCRLLVEKVGQDERTDAMVLQTVGEKSYDGFLIAAVRDDILEYLKSKQI